VNIAQRAPVEGRLKRVGARCRHAAGGARAVTVSLLSLAVFPESPAIGFIVSPKSGAHKG
jgi:hypothetical protein